MSNSRQKKEQEHMTTLYHNNGKPLVNHKEGHKKLMRDAARELGFKKLDKKARAKLREHLKEAMRKHQQEKAALEAKRESPEQGQ